MSLNAWQRNIVDEAGNVISEAEIEIFHAGESTKPIIYSDLSGTSLTNPFDATIAGFAQFYAIDGFYDIAVNGVVLWENEQLGSGVYDTPAQAALASLPVGAKYSTKGADAVGDGGHGDFIVEAASGTPDVYSRILLANGNHGVLQPVNGVVNTSQFGCAGNGATDDTAAAQRAIDFAANSCSLAVVGTINQTGITIPSNSIVFGAHAGAGFFGTGLINASALGAENQTIKDVSIGGSAQLKIGSPASSSFAKKITIARIDIRSSAPTPMLVTFVDGLNSEGVTIELTGSGQNSGYRIGNIKNSSIKNTRISGNVSMGFYCSGTSSVLFASMENCVVDGVYVDKSDSYANHTGDHGVYMLGMSGTTVTNVFVNGNWTETSTYGFKFRDSHDCEISNVRTKTFRVSADNNTIIYQHTLRNKVVNLVCDELWLFKNAAGLITNLTFEDVTASTWVSSNTISGPVIFTGNVYFGKTGDIQLDGCEFRNAVIDIANMNETTNRLISGCTASSSEFKNVLHAYNQPINLANCKINGNLRFDLPNGQSRTNNISNCYVNGSFYANSFDLRVVTANISNTTFNANEDASANNNPDIKKYRFVAFNDVVYNLLNLP